MPGLFNGFCLLVSIFSIQFAAEFFISSIRAGVPWGQTLCVSCLLLYIQCIEQGLACNRCSINRWLRKHKDPNMNSIIFKMNIYIQIYLDQHTGCINYQHSIPWTRWEAGFINIITQIGHWNLNWSGNRCGKAITQGWIPLLLIYVLFFPLSVPFPLLCTGQKWALAAVRRLLLLLLLSAKNLQHKRI